MNAKKGLLVILIGAFVMGAITNVSADEIHPDMDTTIGIEDTEDSWEDQPFWDDPNVKGGDLIIAPAPNEDEQDEELDILPGKTESTDENVVMNTGLPVVGVIGTIGILGTALILIKKRKIE